MVYGIGNQQYQIISYNNIGCIIETSVILYDLFFFIGYLNIKDSNMTLGDSIGITDI